MKTETKFGIAIVIVGCLSILIFYVLYSNIFKLRHIKDKHKKKIIAYLIYNHVAVLITASLFIICLMIATVDSNSKFYAIFSYFFPAFLCYSFIKDSEYDEIVKIERRNKVIITLSLISIIICTILIIYCLWLRKLM
jgi:hypothetical protein